MTFIKRLVSIMCVTALLMTSAFVSYAEDVSTSAPASGPGSSSGAISVKKDVTGPGAKLFNGEEIMMLANQSESQMESYVITTKNGSIIVVDGGLDADADHLREVLTAKGGHVSAWFITHPHSDHVGALTKMLQDGLKDITIDKIYYNFLDMNFYTTNEAYRAQMVSDCEQALLSLTPGICQVVHRGDVITVDSVTVTVMNNPYQFPTNAINNSSVVYRMQIGSKIVTFLGDLGEEAGNQFLKDHQGEDLKTDVVQMAHHGQYGVDKNFYAQLAPTVCMWNAPAWLYDNPEGKYLTLEVRAWMDEISAHSNYCIKDGDQYIR